MRTRETIEAQSLTAKDLSEKPKRKVRVHPNSLKNLKPFVPGQSGNPNGRPKTDMSQVIARALFENNPQIIYAAYGDLLRKGSAFGFQVLSERAYGKLKETRDTGSEYNEIPDADLQSRLDSILRDLGLAQQVDACGGSQSHSVGTEKANGAAKDSELLPR